MKKILFLLCLLLFLTSCHRDDSGTTSLLSLENLNRKDRVLSAPPGTLAGDILEEKFDRAKILSFDTLEDGFQAVRNRKVDAFVYDRHSLEHVVGTSEDLVMMPEELAPGHITVGLPVRHEELRREVNKFIAQYRSDGTYEDMYRRWFSGEPGPMPEIPDPENPTRHLTVGTEGFNVPMNYFGPDKKLIGFDMEFVKRLALFLNAKVDIVTNTFDVLLSDVEAGKIDLLVANLNAFGARTERMLFSDDYLDSAICVLVRRDRLHVDPHQLKIEEPAQLNHPLFRIGAEIGTLAMETAARQLPKARLKRFKNAEELLEALETKTIDAVVYDRASLDYAAGNHPNLSLLQADLGFGNIAAAAPLKNKELVEKVNEFIKTYQADGTYDQMYARWILSADRSMPEIPEPKNPDRVIVVGTDCDNEPMNFKGPDGTVTGFDIEFIKRLALFLNVRCELQLIPYDELYEAAANGKIDLGIATLDATEKRRESMLFSQPYIDNSIAVMIHRDRAVEKEKQIYNLEDLYEKRIGILTGSTSDTAAREVLASSHHVHFNMVGEMVIALDTGRIDALLMDEVLTPILLKTKPGMRRLNETFCRNDYAFLFSKQNADLHKEFSEEITRLTADGTLKKLEQKWFDEDHATAVSVKPNPEAPRGKLRMATIPQFAPFTFIRNGEVVGYDIDVAIMVGNRLGYHIEPVIQEWTGFIESVAANKTDFGGGALNVTEERKQTVLFSTPTIQGGVAVIVKKSDNGQSEHKTFMQKLVQFKNEFSASFERTFLRENRWKLLLQGLNVTLTITFLSAFFGTFGAFLVCSMRRSKRLLPRITAQLMIAVIQGTPMLVILMLLYYVVFGRININAISVAVIGFSLLFAVNIGEIIRSALDSIPHGQTEAGLSLGFGKMHTFLKIIVPQMLRRILPMYRGELISMLKLTAIVGYIAIQDLTKMSDIIRSRTYEAFFPLIMTAIIYFTVARLIAFVLSRLEIYLTPRKKRTR